MIRIDGYPIDLALTEDHSFQSEVTEYPVESGADVSDNIRNKPLEITLEGLVSDTPIGAIAQDPTRQTGSGAPLPSRDAYTRLVAIRDARELVTIETSLGKFERMALTNIGVPRDRSTGKALKFTVTFRQVTLVTNARVTVRVAVPNASGKRNGGNRQPKVPLKIGGARVTPVVSFPTSARASVSPSLGKPVLTTRREERLANRGLDDKTKDWFWNEGGGIDSVDHYELTSPGQLADGYVSYRTGPGQYVRYAVRVDTRGVGAGHGSSTTRTKEWIGQREVTWDYADNEWKDSETGETVRKVPPNEDKWKGVVQRRAEKGPPPAGRSSFWDSLKR